MKEVQLRNHQRARRINIRALREITKALLDDELELDTYEVAIHLVNARKMAGLNEQFLQHSGSTDVITFNYREGYSEAGSEPLDLAGEIYISVPDALKQAREFSTDWREEIVRYIIHGILHLRGYDDLESAKRRIMKREENRLTRRLRAQFALSRIGR